MPKVMKICKACGKEYEACQTPNPGVFRWRDVACSPECAERYIRDVMIARGELAAEPAEAPKVESTNVTEQSEGDMPAERKDEIRQPEPTIEREAEEQPVRFNRPKRK